jgi:hypothetical protein
MPGAAFILETSFSAFVGCCYEVLKNESTLYVVGM